MTGQARLHFEWVSPGILLLDVTKTNYTIAQALARTRHIAGIKSCKKEPTEKHRKVLRIMLWPRGYSHNPKRLDLLVNALARIFLVEDGALSFTTEEDVTRDEWVAAWAKL